MAVDASEENSLEPKWEEKPGLEVKSYHLDKFRTDYSIQDKVRSVIQVSCFVSLLANMECRRTLLRVRRARVCVFLWRVCLSE